MFEYFYCTTLFGLICYYFYKQIVKTYEKCNTLLFEEEINNIKDADVIFITNKSDINSKYIVSIDDSKKLIKILQKNSKTEKPLYLVIHSSGGDVTESDMMINALLQHKNPIYTFVPIYAASAATLIALIGDKIFMDSYSCLTPTDPQICVNYGNQNEKVFSSRVLMEFLNMVQKKVLSVTESVFVLEAIDAKIYHNDNIETLRRIIDMRRISRTNMNKIIEIFGSGNLPHHYPINPYELKKLGIRVEINIPEPIVKIFKYYQKFII